MAITADTLLLQAQLDAQVQQRSPTSRPGR
jgi:hypothetical protein